MVTVRLVAATGGLALAIGVAAPAQAQKLTVTCESAALAAYDKDAEKPYELLQVRKFVVKVDVEGKTCAVESAEAVYLKGRSEPQNFVSDPMAAKCDLRATDKGRVFMNGRAHLRADKALAAPILTINYEVRKDPPAAGSTEAKGEYFIISGFPLQKPKNAKIETRIKVNCVQMKPAS